ncbi:MAG: transporter substrate-binding protein [Spirochaetales bacterium]|nr:transporter substrate-binding protein [Spirochaetales bacterium]
MATIMALFAGCFLIEGEARADTIMIGAVLSMTGKTSYVGKVQAKTLAMLADGINARGGLRGQKIELIILDSQPVRRAHRGPEEIAIRDCPVRIAFLLFDRYSIRPVRNSEGMES